MRIVSSPNSSKITVRTVAFEESRVADLLAPHGTALSDGERAASRCGPTLSDTARRRQLPQRRFLLGREILRRRFTGARFEPDGPASTAENGLAVDQAHQVAELNRQHFLEEPDAALCRTTRLSTRDRL